MSTIELEAEKAMLIRDILNIDDINIFKDLKKAINSFLASKNEYIEKEEILSAIDEGLIDIKAGRCLKVEDFLMELEDE